MQLALLRYASHAALPGHAGAPLLPTGDDDGTLLPAGDDDQA